MLVYLYDSNTKIFIGEYICQKNPKRPNEFLIPKYSTDIKPIENKKGYNVVFSEKNKIWKYEENEQTKKERLEIEEKERLENNKTLEEIKQEKLNILDNETQKFIYSKYPIYKQLNIINPLNDYSEENRNNMNEFINNIRYKNNNFIEQINNCTTKKELDLIDINFE